MVSVGVYGATGYTGLELLRILARHPSAELTFATSRKHAGTRLGEVFEGAPDPEFVLVHPDDADPASVQIAFLCLPHGAAAQTAVRALEAGARVIDLSADFRLRDADTYAEWYGFEHPAPERLDDAVYGLVEHARARVAEARLVANPGCYPTSVLLPLIPLVDAGALAPGTTIIADSKSGVSGAGRGAKLHTSFAELSGNFMPYGIGRAHRHLPEIEQELAVAAGAKVSVRNESVMSQASNDGSAPSTVPATAPRLLFTPHLLPVERGILSTLYITLASGWDGDAARATLESAYDNEPFVRVLREGERASLAHVVHTNRCVMSLHPVEDGETTTLIIASAIDNLVKGAAGQAVQNMNVMLGLDETAGLM